MWNEELEICKWILSIVKDNFEILQFDPRGMYYGITLVVSFHPMFITKVDQAFHVKCFFEEANRGLTAELGVR